MTDREQVEAEYDYVLTKVREWRKRVTKTDSGSYCGNASREYHRTAKVLQAYRDLRDALMVFEDLK